MVAEKLYLHIGCPKTGTTAIQSTLSAKRDLLINHGILYPKTGIQSMAHHKLARPFQGRRSFDWIDYDERIDYYSSLRDEIKCADVPVIFLSSESFYVIPDPAPLYKELSSCAKEIEVIVYLRRQDMWAESNFTQVYKTSPIPFDFYKFVKTDLLTSMLDYNAFITVWEKSFGQKNVRLELIDPVYGAKDSLKPIYDLLGIKEEDIPPISQRRLNVRPSISALHFLHYLYTMEVNKIPERLLADIMAFSQEEGSRYTFLSSEERKAFMARYNHSNSLLAQRYFNRDALFSSGDYYNGYKTIKTGALLDKNGEMNLSSLISLLKLS